MSQTQLAAQLYTLRQFTQTPADIAKTLHRVKQMGYDAVQVSGFGPIDPKELANILNGEGLICCATHTPLDRMKNEFETVVENHRLWQCDYTAIGGFWQDSYTAQTWIDFAKQYSDLANKFESAGGPKIGYHNHSHEFAPFNGKSALQILMENFLPSVWMEIDTYWVQHGGADPIAWIKKCAGRLPCIHLKDMTIQPSRPVEQLMAEVGEGNLNWPGILDACRSAGVQWYIVEQDECQRDPFESLAISLRNLRAMGMR
jgi:sugar phosphate isomerase/epimerase